MRVAYLITSHTLPDQVLRLVRCLRTASPAAPLVVHHDDERSRLDENALRRIGGVELIRPPTPVQWGWAAQLQMFLRCLSWVLERVDFDWVVILSGQDYPIRPVADIERDLTTSEYDAYAEGEVVAAPSWSRTQADEFSRRYFYRYRAIRSPGPRVRSAVIAARPLLTLRDLPTLTLLGRRCETPFSEELRCRRGSDWLTLTRRAVRTVVDTARARPDLIRHYGRTVLPTESFPQTVLHAQPGLRLSTDSRRFTQWAPGGLHPDVLRMTDIDRMLASGADFARKFDITVDGAVLKQLDRLLARQ